MKAATKLYQVAEEPCIIIFLRILYLRTNKTAATNRRPTDPKFCILIIENYYRVICYYTHIRYVTLSV